MRVRGSTVAVVGGSIAGCAAAITLGRAGCRVVVLERSRDLHDRGFGIGIGDAQWQDFVDAGYLDADLPVVPNAERRMVVRDDDVDPVLGRTLWVHPLPFRMTNWGVLWRALRARIADRVDWRHARVTAVRDTGRGCVVEVDGGPDVEADVVLGADGYRSVVRGLLDPGPARYAGYVLWRGNYPLARVPGPVGALDQAVAAVFDGGHVIYYRIPGRSGDGAEVNWALYGTAPQLGPAPAPIPPGGVSTDLTARLHELAAHLPGYWADVVRQTRPAELGLQPVYDLAVRRYAGERVLLAGDAGAVLRPHTGSGAVKAVQDAVVLAKACARHQDWAQVCQEYDASRTRNGAALVELGRRLGDAQVRHTPHWPTMSESDLRAWWSAAMNG